MNLHITGSNGFVGRELCRELTRRGIDYSRSSRTPGGGQGDFFSIGDIGPQTEWSRALKRTEVVIHLAARVHVLVDQSRDSLTEFRRVNCAGTLNLARQAARLGVRRFVYVSSIGVNGRSTEGTAFTEQHDPSPSSGYAISKWEAEKGLAEMARDSGMELVIVRPPLVYGPEVKGNFRRLMQAVSLNLPLPLGSVRNIRSFISIYNLVDFLILCAFAPPAANQLFLVSDGEDLSTPELIRRVAVQMGRTPWLLPFPVNWLQAGARMFGKSAIFHRLCTSLQVGISKSKQVLGWVPPVSMADALQRTVRGVRDPDHTPACPSEGSPSSRC